MKKRVRFDLSSTTVHPNPLDSQNTFHEENASTAGTMRISSRAFEAPSDPAARVAKKVSNNFISTSAQAHASSSTHPSSATTANDSGAVLQSKDFLKNEDDTKAVFQATQLSDVKKPRYWTREEHLKFLDALGRNPKLSLKAMAAQVGTRNAVQTRTHYQKYIKRIERIAMQVASNICREEKTDAPQSMNKMDQDLAKLTIFIAVVDDYKTFYIDMAEQPKKKRRRS